MHDATRINSRDYWDARFGSGDWAKVGGPSQTREFALAQVRRLPLPRDFAGVLLDFGCGLGDALPVYRATWPNAKLVGVDFSADAIEQCKRRHGDVASFVRADHTDCPAADVIVCSNVMEHLDDDLGVARALAARCRTLYVVVPYREQFLIDEHVRAYGDDAFAELGARRIAVFASRGWSQYGLRARWWQIHLKNLLRPLFGKPRLRRRLQAMYAIAGGAQP